MAASYGETSGFAPVTGDELTAVNGGFWLELGIAAVVVAVIYTVTTYQGCPMPYLDNDSGSSGDDSGGGGK